MKHISVCLAAVVLLAFASSLALAQLPPSYELYWVDDNSDQIWAYPDTNGVIINPTPTFSGVTALGLAQGGDLLIGMDFGGISRMDPITTAVDVLDPYAYNVGELCEDGETGDIFWISGSGYYELWVLPEDASTSTVALTFMDQPLDIDVVPGGEHAGNVLVLLDSYGASPMLVELERTGEFAFSVIDTVYTMWENSPRAFSFMPDGTIIVVDHSDGMILLDIDDGYIGQFGTFQSTGLDDISVGSDGTVYVHDSSYHRVLRFGETGMQLMPTLFGPLWGGAIEAVGFTPTPPGSNVHVYPALNVDVLYEEVTNGGYTTAELTESDSRTSPGGNTLPEFVDPPGGRSEFTYISATSSAVYENLIQVDVYLPGSRFFVAQGTGGTFHDVTVVGSIEDARGVISRFDSPIEVPGGGSRVDGPTEFVLGEDTRIPAYVADAKFARLIAILSEGEEHSHSNTMDLVYARQYLLRRALTAQTIFDEGDEAGAIAELAMMNADIRAFAGVIIPNSSEHELGNIAGEMLARSKTLMFSLGLLVGPERGAAVESSGAALALASPNPVRGECTMQLTGPAGERAVAAIYTVGGRLVTTLFEGELKAGTHELVWDGTDDSERTVASGVYLTRAIAGAEVATGKLVYVR